MSNGKKIFDMGEVESKYVGWNAGWDKFARAPIARPREVASNRRAINPLLILNEMSWWMIEGLLGDVHDVLKGLWRPPRKQPYTDDIDS